MTVAVQQPNTPAKKDPMDQLQQALGIATSVYGVALDKQKTNAILEQNRLDRQKADSRYETEQAQKTAENDYKKQQDELNFNEKFLTLPPDKKDPEAFALKKPDGTTSLVIPRSVIKDRADRADKAKKDGKQQMTAGAATEVGEMQAVNKMIDDLENRYKEAASAGGSGISSMIPGSKASNYLQDKKASTQAIGVVLEKGKMTDGDREFYNTMMPDPWDSNETAKAKIGALRRYAKTKQEAQISGLKQGGFDVSGVNIPQAAPQQNQLQLSPRAQAAIAEKLKRSQAGTAGK